jgi:pimeloyl-ACP methyl ester carboxylesterase
MHNIEADDRHDTFTSHAFAEQLVDLGDVRLNYATTGGAELPALLLVPGQSESWWGYEQAMPLLAEHFQVYAVDLRGQGRSSWTPGRYTLDIWGNDLVRFIDLVIGRPAVVSGNSSGGILAAWLAAYGKPGQVRGAVLEDAPVFASEVRPACGQSISQSIGPMFAMWNKWLGDQWSIGDWKGMQAAAPKELPGWMLAALKGMGFGDADGEAGPPRNLREYDPEWARVFWTGTAGASCDHVRMLSSIRTPVLFTHHFRMIDGGTGALMGAVSDQQAARARDLVTAAGQPFEYASFPEMGHSMHRLAPELFTKTVIDWSSTLA